MNKTKYKFLTSLIGASVMLASGQAESKYDDVSVQIKIALSATIPAANVSNALETFSVDGYHRYLEYIIDESTFEPIYFQVRTKSPLGETPKPYTLTETYNNMICSADKGDNLSVAMKVSVNGHPIDATGKYNFSGDGVWYEGSDSYYSQMVIGLESPIIDRKNTGQWCSGRASFLVSETL